MENIELFMKAGFNLYESKILLSLAKLKAAPIKEIELDSKVPRNKIYEILDSFKKKGIVKLLPTKPKKYDLVNLHKTIKQQIDEKRKVLDKIDNKIETALQKIDELHTYEETFWVTEGTEAMVEKIVETLDEIKEESIGFIDVWVAKPENLFKVKEAIERGVAFYFIGTIDKNSRDVARKFAKLGVKIRNYPITGAGYSIFDKKHVQVRISDDKLINLWIENEHFAEILRQHFFELWKKAKPVYFR